MAKRLRWLVAFSCLVWGAYLGCSSGPRASVVLVTIDTLRADHLGCYGYFRDTSPFIDGLAAVQGFYVTISRPPTFSWRDTSF